MGDVADLSIGPPGTPEVVDDGQGDGEPRRSWSDRLLGPTAEEGAVDGAPVVAPFDPRAAEDFLAGMTGALSMLWTDPDVPDLWVMTDDELRQLSAYLARVASRRPMVARAIERGDGLVAAVVVAEYVGRNTGELTAAREARKTRRWPDGDVDREADADARRDGAPADGAAHGGVGLR